MKIDYPVVEWADIKEGDLVLFRYKLGNGGTAFYEVKIEDKEDDQIAGYTDAEVIYLIDRPMPKFPEEYGSVIIAYEVRGMPFPEGIPLARQRGGYTQYGGPYWKSFTQKVVGADQHGERQIGEWVLAKVVPA